jgi:hypothetical protein
MVSRCFYSKQECGHCDSLFFDVVAREETCSLSRDVLAARYDSTSEPLIVDWQSACDAIGVTCLLRPQ